MPDYRLHQKERDGAKAGYPRHLCHLLRYEYTLALPDTPVTKSYLEWYCASGSNLPIGIMLMSYDDFKDVWGASEAAAVDETLWITGRPPTHWYLVPYIAGYNANAGFWEVTSSSPPIKEPWINQERMTDGAFIGKPVYLIN